MESTLEAMGKVEREKDRVSEEQVKIYTYN